MKNKIFIPVLILFVIIFDLGCSQKENKSGNQPVVSATTINNLQSVDMHGQKVFLKYQFKKGEQLRYKLTAITNAQQTIKTDSLIKSDANQIITYFFDIDVLETDPENVAELSINISHVTFNGNFNGQKLNYDSKANTTQEDKLKFLNYETIANSPFRVRVNQKGEILDITRIDKMIDKMITLQSPKQEVPADQKAELSKNISEQALRPITQLLFRELSIKEVGKDSTWQKSSAGDIGVFKLDNTTLFKVEDFVKVGNDNTAKLSANLSVKWSGNKKGSQGGMNYVFDDPILSGSGIILFNIDKGMIVRGETSTNVEMNVQIEGKDASQKMKKAKRKDYSMNKNIVELL